MRDQRDIIGIRRLAGVLVVVGLALAAAHAPAAPAAGGQIALDSQAVAEPFGSESPGKRRRWLRADSDGDGLSNRVETRRTLTNPRRPDSDGDGLTDGIEARLTHTNPRRADSDGDGFGDGIELFAATNPWDPTSVPGLAPVPHPPQVAPQPPAAVSDPGPDPDPPPPPIGEVAKAVWSAPIGAQINTPVSLDGTASTGAGPIVCSWTFEDAGGGTHDERSGCSVNFTFTEPGAKYVTLTVQGAVGGPDKDKKSFDVAENSDPPSPDTTPPSTTITAAPPATTTSSSASFSFNSNEPSSSFQCKLDGGSFASCGSPKSYAGLSVGGHSFEVRATDTAGNTDPTPSKHTWAVEDEGDPPPPPPPPGDFPDACDEADASEATTASQVRNAVDDGEDVCVTADLGNVDLGDLGASPSTVSTEGGSMREIDLGSTSDVTISRARFRSITLRNSHHSRLLGNTIGGTPAARVDDQLIFMPDTNNDVTVEGNDIGWTVADSSGNTGYGCRCYGTLNRLRFVGNKLHDLAADGFQGVGGSDVTIDRNEIGPVGRNPGSSEHSDNIQITGNGDNLRITNNWIHHQGYFDGGVSVNAGSTYIHGGDSSPLIYENNLIETAQGRTEICGLGTGGTSRSNITIRRNTWVDGGKAFSNFPGFEWDCDSGSGNTITRNVAVDAGGGFADNGYDAAIVAPNIFGKPSSVTLDADGNCTSANCNPAGQEPIGYRKPSGVNW